MTDTFIALTQIPLDDQALRAADAGWETARWTFWLVVATGLLVLGAAAAALYARRTWKTAQAQLAMMHASEYTREASSVSAWLHHPRLDGAMSVRLRNDNPAPVYDVRFKLLGKRRAADRPGDIVRDLHHGILPPSSDGGTVAPKSGTVSEVDFREDREYPILKSAEFVPWNGDPAAAGVALEVTFRDSRGVKWKRDAMGGLVELDSGTGAAAQWSKPLLQVGPVSARK